MGYTCRGLHWLAGRSRNGALEVCVEIRRHELQQANVERAQGQRVRHQLPFKAGLCAVNSPITRACARLGGAGSKGELLERAALVVE